jgi:hypothetical protein
MAFTVSFSLVLTLIVRAGRSETFAATAAYVGPFSSNDFTVCSLTESSDADLLPYRWLLSQARTSTGTLEDGIPPTIDPAFGVRWWRVASVLPSIRLGSVVHPARRSQR